MRKRVNLCKVSPELRDRCDDLRGEKSWPTFIEDVADALERGVSVDVERLGQGRATTELAPGERMEAVSETMAVTVSFAADVYTCDECERDFPISKVLVLDGGDRVVCGDCMTVEDRIVE